jgi:hypothetical protein
VVPYRKGRFYTAKVGTKDLLQCAASRRYVIHTLSVRSSILVRYSNESISIAVGGLQEPVQCASSLLAIQLKYVLCSRSRRSERIAVGIKSTFCDFRADFSKL